MTKTRVIHRILRSYHVHTTLIKSFDSYPLLVSLFVIRAWTLVGIHRDNFKLECERSRHTSFESESKNIFLVVYDI